MILDDCLMTITPSSSLSASDVDLSQPLPTYKSSFTNSFAVYNSFYLAASNLARASHRPPFSSQLSLQLELLFVLFVVPVRGTYSFLGIVTPHSYTALLSIIMSLYYLNEFHACCLVSALVHQVDTDVYLAHMPTQAM